MNFLTTVTEQLNARMKLKAIADSKAQEVWEEDYQAFCVRKNTFIDDCVEAGLDILYVEEAIKFPAPMPDAVSVVHSVNVFGYDIRVSVLAGNHLWPPSDLRTASQTKYSYSVSVTTSQIPGSNTYKCLTDPDAKSLHDGLVQVSKECLAALL
jgi:hypothetical protein